MKTITLYLTVITLLATTQLAQAGGNTSMADLDRVTSTNIEAEKITIVGSGMVIKRVMSDAEHGDHRAFGQPAQWFHAKVNDCTFEIVPYHVRDDLEGVPGAHPKDMTPEMKAQSMTWWKETLAAAKEIRAGDAVTIGYQREKMTIVSLYITHIIGSGSVRKQTAPNEKK